MAHRLLSILLSEHASADVDARWCLSEGDYERPKEVAALCESLTGIDLTEMRRVCLSEGTDLEPAMWAYGVSLRPGEEGITAGTRIKRSESGRPMRFEMVKTEDVHPSEPISEAEVRDPKAVEINRQKIKEGDDLSPVVLSAAHDLLDGHHRYAAHVQEGSERVPSWIELRGPHERQRVRLAEYVPPEQSEDYRGSDLLKSGVEGNYVRDEQVAGHPLRFEGDLNPDFMHRQGKTHLVVTNRSNGRPVGRISGDYDKDAKVLRIWGSGISPEYHGLGVGRRMYEHAIGMAHQGGLARVLSDDGVSKEAQNVYRRLKQIGYAVRDGVPSKYDLFGDSFEEPFSVETKPAGPIKLSEPQPLTDHAFDMDVFHQIPPEHGSWIEGQNGKPQMFYHGTTRDFDTFKPQGSGGFIGFPGSVNLDRLIGHHFSIDPKVAAKFTQDKYKTQTLDSGRIMPVKVWSRNVYDVPQTNGSDAYDIYNDALRHVFDKNTPEARNLFASVMAHVHRNESDPNDYLDAHAAHMDGKPYAYSGRGLSLNSRQADWLDRHEAITPSKIIMQRTSPCMADMPETSRGELVRRYINSLQDKGYDALRYRNTAPMETQNVDDPTSLIVFDPRRIKGYFNPTPNFRDPRIMMAERHGGSNDALERSARKLSRKVVQKIPYGWLSPAGTFVPNEGDPPVYHADTALELTKGVNSMRPDDEYDAMDAIHSHSFIRIGSSPNRPGVHSRIAATGPQKEWIDNNMRPDFPWEHQPVGQDSSDEGRGMRSWLESQKRTSSPTTNIRQFLSEEDEEPKPTDAQMVEDQMRRFMGGHQVGYDPSEVIPFTTKASWIGPSGTFYKLGHQYTHSPPEHMEAAYRGLIGTHLEPSEMYHEPVRVLHRLGFVRHAGGGNVEIGSHVTPESLQSLRDLESTLGSPLRIEQHENYGPEINGVNKLEALAKQGSGNIKLAEIPKDELEAKMSAYLEGKDQDYDGNWIAPSGRPYAIQDSAGANYRNHDFTSRSALGLSPLQLMDQGWVRHRVGWNDEGETNVDFTKPPTPAQFRTIRGMHQGGDLFWGNNNTKQQGDTWQGLRAHMQGSQADPRIHMAEGEPGGFYSKLSRVISQLVPNRATPGQILGTLKGAGVKPDELTWTGTDKFLAGMGDQPVDKQALLDHVEANRVDINKIVKGTLPDLTLDDIAPREERIRQIKSWSDAPFDLEQQGEYEFEKEHEFRNSIPDYDQWGNEVERPQESPEDYTDRQRAFVEDYVNRGIEELADDDDWWHEAKQDALRERAQKAGINSKEEPKFGQYTLPGGENYREMLMTLPEDQNATHAMHDARIKQLIERRDGIQNQLTSMSDGSDQAEELERQLRNTRTQIDMAMRDRTPVGYKSSHWDEPNVVAHARFDDRTLPNGEKALHVAEIQSDWHQQGRKRGYQTQPITELPQGFKAIPLQDGKWWVADENGLDANRAPNGDQAELFATRQEAEAAAIQNLNSSASNMQQYDERLPDAPFKKTEQWAGLAFKHLLDHAVRNNYNHITWDTGDTNGDRYDLSKHVDSVHYNPGTQRFIAMKNGQRAADETFPPEKLENYVGKEVAQRLIGTQPNENGLHSLSGEGLRVGAEGMRSFYDTILPNLVGKYVKPFGGKVDQASILTNRNDNWKVHNPTTGLIHGMYEDRGMAERQAKMYGPHLIVSPNGPAVHHLAITPELRGHVLHHGQALFSEGRCRVRLAEYEPGDKSDYGFFDRLNDARDDVMYPFLRNPDEPQQWETVPAHRLAKIWTDYGKTGIVRDTRGMDDISDRMIHNTLKLHANTDFMGHTDNGGDAMGDWADRNGEEISDELKDKFPDHVIDPKSGQWRISDYALKPLMNDAFDLHKENDHVKKLGIVDRMLNRVHPRSDVAGMFVEGGSDTLNKIKHAGTSKGVTLADPMEPHDPMKPTGGSTGTNGLNSIGGSSMSHPSAGPATGSATKLAKPKPMKFLSEPEARDKSGKWTSTHGALFSPPETKTPDLPNDHLDKEATFQAAGKTHGEYERLMHNTIAAKHLGGTGVTIKDDDGGASREARERILNSKGAATLVAKIKSPERAESKVTNEYGGNWTQIKDLVRGTIAVDSHHDIPRAVNAVRSALAEHGWTLSRPPKDRVTKPTSVGYKDILLNAKSPDGINTEIQIVTKPMLKAKQEAHPHYAAQTELERKVQSEGRDYTPEEKTQHAHHISRQREIYGAVE